MKKTGLYVYVYNFLVDYDNIGLDNILDIHKHLMKKHKIKCLDIYIYIFLLLSACKTESFGVLLAINSKGRQKCLSLNNRPCQPRATLINIKSKQLIYYAF